MIPAAYANRHYQFSHHATKPGVTRERHHRGAAKVTAEGTHRVERVNGASRLHLGSRPGCAGYEREGHSARRLRAQSSASGISSRGPHQKNGSGRDLPWGELEPALATGAAI